MPQLSETVKEVDRLIRLVGRLISLNVHELPDEFFPAHLSVALVDAVFRSREEQDDEAAQAADRYCRASCIARVRADRWELPPVEEQETLSDLIRRFDAPGADSTIGDAFVAGNPLADMAATNTGYVLRAARALRNLGISVLQDVSIRSAEEIEHALQFSAGLERTAARLLLMYTGNDDFVLGDGHIRDFVALAIGHNHVCAGMAEQLVRHAAYEIVVSPRFLDCAIWRYGVMQTATANGIR